MMRTEPKLLWRNVNPVHKIWEASYKHVRLNIREKDKSFVGAIIMPDTEATYVTVPSRGTFASAEALLCAVIDHVVSIQ